MSLKSFPNPTESEIPDWPPVWNGTNDFLGETVRTVDWIHPEDGSLIKFWFNDDAEEHPPYGSVRGAIRVSAEVAEG